MNTHFSPDQKEQLPDKNSGRGTGNVLLIGGSAAAAYGVARFAEPETIEGEYTFSISSVEDSEFSIAKSDLVDTGYITLTGFGVAAVAAGVRKLLRAKR